MKNNLLTKYQSGFRQKRSTVDNIYYFKQKCLKAFEKKHKVCGVVFDIEKAFDKVWHEGLLFKLHQLKVPQKIGLWIKNFLDNRKFIVSVNNETSEQKSILTGVPQGAILSPILFLVYVNDIPLTVQNYASSISLLFANDLYHFYSDKNLNRIEIVIQKYLMALNGV